MKKITIKLTKEQKNLLLHLSRKRGVAISEYIRLCIKDLI